MVPQVFVFIIILLGISYGFADSLPIEEAESVKSCYRLTVFGVKFPQVFILSTKLTKDEYF